MAEARRTVTIVNDLGLHARAASKLVQLASKYPVEVQIGREDMMVNAKSIMGVLMLAASKGTHLQVFATGADTDATPGSRSSTLATQSRPAGGRHVGVSTRPTDPRLSGSTAPVGTMVRKPWGDSSEAMQTRSSPRATYSCTLSPVTSRNSASAGPAAAARGN